MDVVFKNLQCMLNVVLELKKIMIKKNPRKKNAMKTNARKLEMKAVKWTLKVDMYRMNFMIKLKDVKWIKMEVLRVI